MSNIKTLLPRGFVQRYGFISADHYSWTTRGYIYEAAKELAASGYRIVLLDNEINPFIITRCQYYPNLIEMGGNEECLRAMNWDRLLALGIENMNEHRRRYNICLAGLFLVERIKLHSSPITLVTTKIKPDRQPILRTYKENNDKKNYCDLATLLPKENRLAITLLKGAEIERWSKDKKVIFCCGGFWHSKSFGFVGDFNESMTVRSEIVIKPLGEQPLSMLTKENFFLERVLHPEPITKKPTII